MSPRHALIVGARGVGKSTLIRRVLEELDRPVFGFETRKEDSLAEEQRGCPVYIYPAGEERRRSRENLIGYSMDKRPQSYRAAFDRYAPRLRGPVPADHVILLDELGFMEAASEEFCGAVLRLLDGTIPVIAAVKDRDVPFLEAVRSHPNCRCFYITPENRDALLGEVLDFMRARTGGVRGE